MLYDFSILISPLFNIKSALCTLYSSLCTLHSALCTLHLSAQESIEDMGSKVDVASVHSQQMEKKLKMFDKVGEQLLGLVSIIKQCFP